MMKLVVCSRLKQCFVAGFVMLGLFVSAVSACACEHHQTKKPEVEPLSCHSASHGEAKTESATADPALPRFDEHCNCIVRTPEPAIVVKAGAKLSKAEKTAPLETGTVPECESSSTVIAVTDSIPFESLHLSSKFFLHFGPSRAPPRL